jgi:hypothetical protein
MLMASPFGKHCFSAMAHREAIKHSLLFRLRDSGHLVEWRLFMGFGLLFSYFFIANGW